MGTKDGSIGTKRAEAPVRGHTAGDTESKSTADTGTGTGGTRGTGGTGSTRTGEKEERVPRLAAVKTEEEKRAERNAKRRERYAAKKAAEPKKLVPNSKKKDADTTQCEAVITTLSTIIASRDGCAHWQLTPDETKSLAQPIANLMAKSDALGQLNEHSDAVALVTAAFTIMMPRLILSNAIRKEKKKHDKGNIGNVKGNAGGKDEGQNSGGAGDGNSKPAADNVIAGQIQPQFGNALCG